MTPDLERFLDAATKPLDSKFEAREEARTELMGRVSHQGVPLEMIDVSNETAILEKPSGRSPWIRRGAMLAGLVACLVLWGVGTTLESLSFARAMFAQQLSFHYRWGGGLGGGSAENPVLAGWQKQVAPDLQITGDPSRFPKLDDETRALRERFPEDLVVLQEHLSRRSSGAAEFMTDEERELVARLDPDNALWLVMESKWLRDKAYGRDVGSFSYMGSSSVPKDTDALALAWKKYLEAASKSKFIDYSGFMVRRQLEAFPLEKGFMDSLLRSGYVDLIFSAGSGRYGLSSYSNSDDFRERVEALVKAENVEGLKMFGAAWRGLNRLMVFSAVGDSQMAARTIESEADQIGDGLMSLKEKELSKEFKDLATRASKVETKSYISSSDPLDELMPIRGDMGVLIPHQLTAEELKPARLAERAFFDRLMAWFGVFVLLLLVLACGFEAYRRSLPVKGMARGLMPLFTWQDQAWVAGLGVAAPWGFWWVVTRLTPLGFRQQGMIDEWGTLGWLVQAAIALVLIMVMLVQTVQWRWAKRGAFLSFRGRVDWLGWVVAGLVALGVPAVGLVRYIAGGDDERGLFLLGMVGLGFVGVLWLLWVGGMNLFTPRHSALRANLVSRTLLPWSILSVSLMLLCVGVLIFAERSWYAKDTLFANSTSQTHANAFEERASTEIQESLQKVFGEE